MEELAVGQRTLATLDGERASWRKRERERECVFVCVYYPPTDGYKRGAGREGEGGKAGGWLCIYINT